MVTAIVGMLYNSPLSWMEARVSGFGGQGELPMARPASGVSVGDVLRALRPIRIRFVGLEEMQLHEILDAALTAADLPFKHHARLSPASEIDFLVDGHIGIEVKKQRPVRASVLKQVTRYAEHEAISAMILVVERALVLPRFVADKPLHVFGLNALWGISL